MRLSTLITCASSVMMAAALLAGCSSGGSQLSGLVSPVASQPHQPSETFAGLKWIGNVRPDQHKSWVSRDAAQTPRLLFESDDGTNDVYIFGLPDLKLYGTLTGFDQPQGLCSDANGNVYITNTGTSQVFEYSHAGKLLNTYQDTYGYPDGCAINPENGDLAVANIRGFSGAGQVLVYSSPTASPTVLRNPHQYSYYFAGYGPYGYQLWADGKNAKGGYMVSQCIASTCSTIKLTGGVIHSPGAVQFDYYEQAWVVFDQGPCASGGSCSYWVYKNENSMLSDPNNYLTYKGGAVCDLIQGMIKDTGNEYVGGADYEHCGNASTSEDRWPYSPELNDPPTNYSTRYVSQPVGAAISIVK